MQKIFNHQGNQRKSQRHTKGNIYNGIRAKDSVIR